MTKRTSVHFGWRVTTRDPEDGGSLAEFRHVGDSDAWPEDTLYDRMVLAFVEHLAREDMDVDP